MYIYSIGQVLKSANISIALEQCFLYYGIQGGGSKIFINIDFIYLFSDVFMKKNVWSKSVSSR